MKSTYTPIIPYPYCEYCFHPLSEENIYTDDEGAWNVHTECRYADYYKMIFFTIRNLIIFPFDLF